MQRSTLLLRRNVTVTLRPVPFRHSSSSSSSPSSPSPSSSLPRSRAVPFLLSSLFAGALAFYTTQLYIAASTPCTNPSIALLTAQKDVSSRYDYTADAFDSEVSLSEWLMGVNSLRKSLARKSRGHVLEISCGTGRNLGYYDLTPRGGVESLTFVDLSPQMVEVCRKKWDALAGGEKGKERWKKGLVVRFLPGNAVEEMPPGLGRAGKYDTVVQTMGVCSTPKPVEMLVNATRYLDMESEGSRVLLLEHGRSYMDWLNRVLDNSAEKHAEIHGCWFNRDVGGIVKEAAETAGLEVVEEKRFHFGTTWMFELRPKGKIVEEEERRDEKVEKVSSWVRWK